MDLSKNAKRHSVGKIGIPKHVKLFVGLITNEISLIERIKDTLMKRFGETDSQSDLLNFDFTAYYDKEMGSDLKRKFLSFKKLISMENINTVKIFTNRLEKKFSAQGKRRINIDPGYISLSKLVLLTTKDYYHRIYLGKGIYAEVTLYYKDKALKPLEWTYPDFKSDNYIEFFKRVRDAYSSQLEC